LTKLVEINGIDESGRVGEIIYFVRVGIGLPFETQIFLRNLEYFGKLIADGNDVKGYDKSTLFKFVVDYMDDPSIDVTIFRLFPDEQLKLLTRLCLEAGRELYAAREPVVSLFDSEGKIAQKDFDVLSKTISEAFNPAKKFRNPQFWIESFIKSFAMRSITGRLESISRLYRIAAQAEHFLVVQIDGGYPFAFWWKDLMSIPNTRFTKGTFVVSGISNGDNYYPAVSTAGIIAQILSFNQERTHLFPIQTLGFSDDAVDFPSFYENHSRAVTLPVFQNRMLFVGQITEGTRQCLPYLMHRRDRRNTYEPFHLGTGFQWFFRRFGKGTPENQLVIVGRALSPTDKENIKFFDKNGYKTLHVSEFKDDVEALLTELTSEIQMSPTQKRTSLSSKLKIVEESCKIEFK
jgi:hypothetical protein